MERVIHQFEPIFDENSKILMLGTMPSPKSREVGFYYGHPRNRFWKVIADVRKEVIPTTIQEKIDFLIKNKIALWDVLKSCDINGADDSSIKNPVANDINYILDNSNVTAIFATGKKAESLYNKYCLKTTGIEIIELPSTSPANCRTSYEQLYEAYTIINKYI
jgi:hypoxanthine-DNA glycosylase